MAKMSENRPSRNTAPELLAKEITTPSSPKVVLATMVMMIEIRSMRAAVILPPCDSFAGFARNAIGNGSNLRYDTRTLGCIGGRP